MPDLWYVVSADYDGEQKKIFLKLYNPETKEIRRWYDTTGHKPYLLTDLDLNTARKIPEVIAAETIQKYDALYDQMKTFTKVYAEDPLKVGGDNSDALRNTIPNQFGAQTWENDIKYYLCYIYDNLVKVGMPYTFDNNGNLLPFIDSEAEERVKDILKVFAGDGKERLASIEEWAKFFEYPAPFSKRTSLDIEVFNVKKRIANPDVADQPVLSAAFWDNEGRKILLALEQPDKEMDLSEIEVGTEILFFNDEAEMLEYTFKILREYPFVFTFNGDEFDLAYLRQRALNLGVKKENIPIVRQKKEMHLTTGIHIDLYKFFFIKAIQVYAFQQKYKNDDLDTIGKALINLPKLKLSPEREREMVEKGTIILTYNELLRYNLRDAEITLKLTTFKNNLVMNLLWALTRVSRMPMESTSRHSVGQWIKSIMFFEHRKRGYIIPNPDDIKKIKGTTVTKAVIKGKKYKGAIVVNPKTGIHFLVVVMDFQSLYPSILKVYNLGYQTVNCLHPECKGNVPKGAPHWVCTKHWAMESVFIGSFKDLRVKHYKQKPKDKSLTEEKKAWYNVAEQTIKVICNASYGVFGADSFPLYCPPVAEQITAIARDAIIRTIEKAQSLGIEVIYGDTDSVFMKRPTEEQLNILIEWAAKELSMDLSAEKRYRYCALSGRKKNYLGVDEDGNVDVKGLTGKKKHTPPIIKNAFEETKVILSKIRTEQEFVAAKEELKKIVRHTYYTLKRREWKSLEDLAYSMNLNKEISDYKKSTPQHVGAAKMLQERGIDVAGGDEIKFIKTTGGKKGHAKPIQLVKDHEVDVEKYCEFLQNTFEQILDAMDLDFNEILGLTKMDKWF